jgi:hypothetical protein
MSNATLVAPRYKTAANGFVPFQGFITGNATADGKLIPNKNGKTFASLPVAVNYSRKDETGEYVEDGVQFFNLMTYNPAVKEAIAKVTKGQAVKFDASRLVFNVTTGANGLKYVNAKIDSVWNFEVFTGDRSEYGAFATPFLFAGTANVGKDGAVIRTSAAGKEYATVSLAVGFTEKQPDGTYGPAIGPDGKQMTLWLSGITHQAESVEALRNAGKGTQVTFEASKILVGKDEAGVPYTTPNANIWNIKVLASKNAGSATAALADDEESYGD